MSLFVDIQKKLKDFTLKVTFETREYSGITGILGASGCGKSMTLKCIAGIETPDSGRIVLNGRILYDSNEHINRKVQDRGVGYLFQNYALFPNMTVRQNIEIARKGNKKEKQQSADTYLKLLQIEELASSYPGHLSGGQQQRAALARILSSNPDVLMLDEPFSALDAYLKEKLQLEILEILKQYHGDILMVTHSRDEVYRFCSLIHILDKGSRVRSGETKAVFKNPMAVAAAKLTGCKNIADVIQLSRYSLSVPAWNTTLEFENLIPESVKAIGIRAHYLRKRTKADSKNIITCTKARILEDPFEVTVILENGIWWKLAKEIWKTEYHEKVPAELVIPEESVLYLQ